MATQKEIRVGSVVLDGGFYGTGIVLAYPAAPRQGRAVGRAPGTEEAADIYWFNRKIIDWEYISYLDVLVK